MTHHHLMRTPHTLLGAEACSDLDQLTADVALYGVPWDAGSLSMQLSPGQRFGPEALRKNNVTLFGCAADARIIDLETGSERLAGVRMSDLGDVDLLPALGVTENFQRITHVAETVAAHGALPVAVGGDHSVSFPAGRGAVWPGGRAPAPFGTNQDDPERTGVLRPRRRGPARAPLAG